MLYDADESWDFNKIQLSLVSIGVSGVIFGILYDAGFLDLISDPNESWDSYIFNFIKSTLWPNGARLLVSIGARLVV